MTQGGWRREVMMKRVVTKGSGDEGKWWRWEVVTKGSGDEGKWWRWEVVTKGSDDEGEWWGREVGTMGSGEEGKWTKGGGDDGKWWRIVMAAWMLHGLCFGEEAGARNLVFFRVKWLQPAMKGTSSVRRVRFGSFRVQSVPPMCFATSGCSCVRSSMRFLNLWLQIALEWLHDCRHLVLPRA